MITRLYVDNFRSLVDFTWRPGAEVVVLGYNGSGKTSVLDAIDVILKCVAGTDRLEDIISWRDITKWKEADPLSFEIDLQTQKGAFFYKIQLAYRPNIGRWIVQGESLKRDDVLLLARREGELEMYDESGLPASRHLVPLTASSLVLLVSLGVSTEEFRTELSQVVVVRPMPPLMLVEAERPDMRVQAKFENFIAWYWEKTLNGNFARSWHGLLEEVWPDFEYIKLEALGRDASGMTIVFSQPKGGSNEFKLDFRQLSEGEKMLLALYSLLAYQRSSPPTTIIIDEPDNFVALSELQPWLLKMLDERPEGGQLIIVSHNAQIMQTFGRENAAYFLRDGHTAPTRVKSISAEETGLSIDELLRRGWLDE